MTAAERPEASWRPVVGERVRLRDVPSSEGVVMDTDGDIAWVRWHGLVRAAWAHHVQPELIAGLEPATDGPAAEEAP